MIDWRARIGEGETTLITGAAGFIGARLAAELISAGKRVVGLDNLNDYYDVALKKARLAQLENLGGNFDFIKADLADRGAMEALFKRHSPVWVAHMGAQAGVRYSIDNPHAYADSNLTGFLNVLEGCRRCGARHLVYASSSSVYGGNRKMPFSTLDSVDHPISLYAATKKANEAMAHSYSHLYGLPATGLRFFTVYGPWGRPDMAYYKFALSIMRGEAIKIYNNGDMSRDFTYIDDIAEGVLRALASPAAPDPAFDVMAPTPATSWAPHRLFNIGNRRPERLMDMIEMLEEALGRKARKEFLPMQPGDVQATFADVSDLEAATGFRPDTPLKTGLEKFADWFLAYYGACHNQPFADTA